MIGPDALVWLAPLWLAGITVVAVPVARRFGARAGYPLALAFGLAAAVAVAVAPAVLAGETAAWSRPWIPAIDVRLALRLDALALVFLLLVLAVGALVLWYSPRYLAHGVAPPVRYYTTLSAFALAMSVVVLADDVVLLYAGWEGTSVASFLLISVRADGRRAAARALLTTFAGGLFLLGAALLAVVETGTGAVGAVAAGDLGSWGGVVAGGLLVAAAAKSAQLPFHGWLPDAMVAPTPVSAYLHAATMVKAGIYLLLRFNALLTAEPAVAGAVTVVGAGTAVFAAAAALRRDDLKEVLAYSTISQLGVMFALIGVGTPLATGAAIALALAHALYKGALFLATGVVSHALETRSLSDLRARGGVRAALPFTSTAAVTAAASMAGLPPLLGFVAKEKTLAALLEGTRPGTLLAAAAVAAALTFTVAYTIRVAVPFLRRGDPTGATFDRLAAAPLVLAVAGIAGGVWATRLTEPVRAATLTALGDAEGVELKLFEGVTIPLVASAAIVAAGATLWWWWARREHGRPGTFGDRSTARGVAGLQHLAGTFDRVLRTPAPAWHLAVVLVAVAGAAAWAALGVARWQAPVGEPGYRWLLAGLLVASAAVVARARDRLAAVASLGAVGFVVAAVFASHGGADLAITQLVVDALTVALIVFVFRELPRRYPETAGLRRLAAVTVAAAVGFALGAAVFVTSAPEPSAVSQRYLAEAPAKGADNVVNAILTDFRALDTAIEASVIAVAAVGVVVVLGAARRERP